MTAPTRPAGLSAVPIVEPSPKPQMSRSVPVGMSLRWMPTSPAPGSIISTVQ
jgi:hypothetical protein